MASVPCFLATKVQPRTVEACRVHKRTDRPSGIGEQVGATFPCGKTWALAKGAPGKHPPRGSAGETSQTEHALAMGPIFFGEELLDGR